MEKAVGNACWRVEAPVPPSCRQRLQLPLNKPPTIKSPSRAWGYARPLLWPTWAATGVLGVGVPAPRDHPTRIRPSNWTKVLFFYYESLLERRTMIKMIYHDSYYRWFYFFAQSSRFSSFWVVFWITTERWIIIILLPTIYDYILKTTQHKHINSTRCHLNANIKSYE